LLSGGPSEASLDLPICDACQTAVPEAELLSDLVPRPKALIASTAAYVYDATCDRTLYGKNEDKPLPPASLTKMMTALVTVDDVANLDRVVSVHTSAKQLVENTGSSVMGLEPDMQVTVRDLLYGLLLPSGNDAALELAKAVSGNVNDFVAEMNQKAAELGLSETHFSNPHGLDDPRLYSTARDLVTLGEAMMANPLLAQIADTVDYTLSDGRSIANGNHMLDGYAGTYGVKIGYTDDADYTIVVAAQRDARQIYASVLGSKVPYADAKALLDWAFSQHVPGC
jgi:D-alanyl-D-alanine carboxypeptidase